MVEGVELFVKSTRTHPSGDVPALQLKLLGPLTISRQGAAQTLPASRKVRALIAYLALAPRPMGRSHLCGLLWDVPNDPRGGLRGCLTKLRTLFDEPGRCRVLSSADHVTLTLGDCFVDVIEITNATRTGIETLDLERLRALHSLFAGDFVEGLELDRSPALSNWIIAQRRRFRACHTAVLEQLVKSLPAESGEMFRYLENWLEHAPLDRRAHELLLHALVRCDRIREAEEHLEATARMFEAEGLDCGPLREAWRAGRNRNPNVLLSTSATVASATAERGAAQARRASIAVMPLLDVAAASGDAGGLLARALAHDIITRLAKLRSLTVIAQGTVFALSERAIAPQEAARTLNVDYVASGSVRRRGDRVTVMMELAETRMARIIWADDFDYKFDDVFLVLEEIGNRIVAAIEREIESAECNRAVLKPPSSLDAWEAYHRGLWHMYRFIGGDNDQAQRFFQMAIRLDPTFARAHAGLSFTHFQNAFLHRTAEREQEVDRACAAAEQSLIVDDRDPAAHWAMGRALWLRGRDDHALIQLHTAVELSPNFALGHYTLAFVHSQSGDPQAAIGSSDYSRHLSPFDPLMFAMLSARAMGHLRLGQFEESAIWAVRSIGRPNAHVHIWAIAAECLAAAGRLDEARATTATIHKTLPYYGTTNLLAAFHHHPDIVALFRKQEREIAFE
jgi:DNA-binding SARP family transcriptional activator